MTVTPSDLAGRVGGGRPLVPVERHRLGLVARLRRDAPWWLLPATVVVVLGAFIGYTVWIATLGTGDAARAPYLSPFYSPRYFAGRVPGVPAFFCLLVPLAFRGSCYYYRKAYWRSFFLDPPACAIGEPRHRYSGETRFPWVLNNLHRFAMYLAVAYIGVLTYDVVQAFSYQGRPYLGVGTLIMLVNIVLLAGYTFSCHSLRHAVGGSVDCWSCVRFGRQRHALWKGISRLNAFHPAWAWVSMFSVAGVDIYIRMLNAGWFLDPHIRF
jgi:hypothetical protein